ncbi:MAG TPA: cytochrome c oxidase subunit II [Acetobacteraceae bacterium]
MITRGALTLADALIARSRTAHASGPMSYLHTFGPAGYPVTRLGWGLGLVACAVVVIIAVLLLGGIFRARRSTAEPASGLAVRRDAGGMAWIYIGVGISILVLIVCMVWTLIVTAAISQPRTAPGLTVQVTASQWWWDLRYDNPQSSRIFTAANEIHIPVGQPVRFELNSADVIHSFWIPKLGGKTDVIPGQTNVTWLQADQPGLYRGQCAVFCGAEHARMALIVVAQTPADFRAWQARQIADASNPVTAQARDGEQLVQSHCAACHTIRGTPAGGHVGPDLTHLMSRQTLAAGVLPNTTGNLAAWIMRPQAIKPGSRMPDQMLSARQLAAVVTYLQTLQ